MTVTLETELPEEVCEQLNHFQMEGELAVAEHNEKLDASGKTTYAELQLAYKNLKPMFQFMEEELSKHALLPS